jgi:hypothetical protein
MFSLFQDNVNSLAGIAVHATFNHHELITAPNNGSSGFDGRIVFDAASGDRAKAGVALPPKQPKQDAWCKQVLKLKNQHPSHTKKNPTKKNPTKPVLPRFHSSSCITNEAPAVPFQQFHSSGSTRTLTQDSPRETAIPFQQFHSSRTLTLQDSHATLVPEEDLEHVAHLPEVRQVRFLGTPEVVQDSDSTDSDRSGVANQQHTNTKRVYWSRNEVESMKRDAVQCAKAFRTKQPATVSRLKQLFEDFCWKQSIDNDYSVDTEDEEEEEMLHRFLIDWGMSNVRGLEERVVPRRVFDQDRRMALESVLAYQQILRQSGVHSQVEMAAMLSTRSESASRRARMFAMYMALGDALAVAAFRSDEVYSDDDSIDFAGDLSSNCRVTP